MTENATAIHHYDVVIIGGGIAGIAIAEFLSRRSRLRIKLMDCAPRLGEGASGKLEGWFHSGALYSGNDDAQTFMNCVNGVEDLINHYSVYFPGRCNMSLQEKSPDLFVPSIMPQREGWFNDAPVYYILPANESPDIKLSRFKNDSVLWEIQRRRVLNRIEAAFGRRHNWRREGVCRAPSYAEIENYREGVCSLRDSSGILNEFCKRHDRSFDLEPSSHDIIKSCDFSINPATIMRDLVASAISNGVSVETGLTIENLVMDLFGPPRIKGLLCRDSRGGLSHLKARLFVFSVGSGFGAFLEKLNLRVRLKTSKSAMVVASPALSKMNFARMSIKNKFHFNHIVQQAGSENGGLQYSMLANSGFSKEEADLEEGVADLDGLLDSAERYFGKEELYSRRLYSYECAKTEFISEEEEKRRYSYWIELTRDGHYISVLPGKFSFFPTVAYQTYLRIKEILDFKEGNTRSQYVLDQKSERSAKELVADHYPLQILSTPL